MIVAAVPNELIDLLDTDAEVVAWDGVGEPTRRDVAFWVPPPRPHSAEQAARSLASLPAVRVVQLLSSGVEPWASVVSPGVTLCSGKPINAGSTAELAVALTLSLLRDLDRYAAQQARGVWEPGGDHARETIVGKHVLVLGAGSIGSRASSVFEVLGAHVSRVSRTGDLNLARARDLLPSVDVVVVALPLTAHTAGLVDSTWLAALPDGAAVVNVARGPIVDTDALMVEVKRGRLRAALDVVDPEPLPSEHPLWSLPGVIITPHIGGGVDGWELRAARLVSEQLTRVDSPAGPRHVVAYGY